MWAAAGHSCGTTLAHDLPAFHHVTFMNINFAHVTVQNCTAARTRSVQHNAIAVNAERRRIDNAAQLFAACTPTCWVLERS